MSFLLNSPTWLYWAFALDMLAIAALLWAVEHAEDDKEGKN